MRRQRTERADSPPLPNPALPRVLVIIPAFCEAKIIDACLSAVFKAVPESEIVVVDDCSPDGTADRVRAHGAYRRRLRLIERAGKRGLGSAYRLGFNAAVDNGFDVCLQMDADLSHDPEDIPRLLQPIAAGAADFVIGSRYCRGGATRNWSIYRRVLSRWAGIYTRRFTGLPVADPTSGFSAIHRRVLTAIDWERCTAEGYVFEIELKLAAWRAGWRLHEVPIVFTERRGGESKMSLGIQLEAAVRVPSLGWRWRKDSGLIPDHRRSFRNE